MSAALVKPPDAAAIEREESLLDRIAAKTADTATRYMPTLTVKQFSEREHMLRELKALLVENIDYGKIPGTGDKPVLLKPGAEKICAFFGYSPHYTSEVIEDWDGHIYGEPLFYYKYTCTLSKDRTPVGEGQGSCNSWETKYRYRTSKRVCPNCGVPALIEGKQWTPSDPKQWVCFEKKGGCKAKFAIDDARVTGQQTGQVKNPDFADTINTIQKMGQKRAMVAAVLSATGASQYFTQDIEDLAPEPSREEAPRDGGVARNVGTSEPATTASTRPIPEELKLVIDQLRHKDYSSVKAISNVIQEEMLVLGLGKSFDDRSAGVRSRFPRGGIIPASAMETFMLDCWDEIEKAKAAKAEPKPEDEKSDWLPEGLGE